MSALLEINGVSKTFSSGFWGKNRTPAVLDATIAIEDGQILGLIGGSGSGKTTLSRMIMGFIRPDVGDIRYQGKSILTLTRAQWRTLREHVQMIFQNPQRALNPRFSVYECCAEPLRLYHLVQNRNQERERVRTMLDSVGITHDLMGKYPHEISGGQAQRIAIVRALALKPKLLICDEPTSMLDISVQAQIIDLLRSVNQEQGCAMLFISHDLDVVKHLCENVAVMHEGKLIEQGPVTRVFEQPRTEFTRSLLAAAL